MILYSCLAIHCLFGIDYVFTLALSGAALTGAESAELQEVLEETNVRAVDL